MDDVEIFSSLFVVIVGIVAALWAICWVLVPFKIYGMARDIKAIRMQR